jgi:large subunit ribosomal protein L21
LLNFLKFHLLAFCPIFGEQFIMYAVIKTGGKQYKVALGDTLRIDKVAANEGNNVDFEEVFLVTDGNTIKVGTPRVDGGKVTAIVQEHGRAKKIKIIKFKRRKHHRKQMGHRQYYTDVKITGIMADGIEATLPADSLQPVEEKSPSTGVVDQKIEAISADTVIEAQVTEIPKGETPSTNVETPKGTQ